jgi:hypothetical protein
MKLRIKRFLILLLPLIFSPNLNFASEFYILPYVEPMEITIGRYLVSKTNIQKAPSYDIANFYFLKNPMIHQNQYLPTSYDFYQYQPNFLNYYSTLNYYHYSHYQKDTFIEIEIIPYLKQTQIPWKNITKDYHIRSSYSYGIFVDQKETLSAFFGIINEQKLQKEIIYAKTPIIEYGKVFFAPGIQLRSSGIVLKTFLEMPLYDYNLINQTQKIYTISPNNIKANFQIQIQN